jgi:hypothetical protein
MILLSMMYEFPYGGYKKSASDEPEALFSPE